MNKPTLVLECGHCHTSRPLDQVKCPRCVTTKHGLVALCGGCGSPMYPDGRDFKGKYQLLRCTQCQQPGRVRQRDLEAAAEHVRRATQR